MSTPSIGSGLSPKGAAPEKSLIPESVKIVLLIVLLLAVVYLFYSASQTQQQMSAQFAQVASDIKGLQDSGKAMEDKHSTDIASLKDEISQAQSAVGTTKAELQKTAQQIKAEGQKTKAELSQAIATKADTTQVQQQVEAVKTEANTKIGQVSSEVGGVKNEVGTVRTDLATTKRDLEGTQRQLIDVRDTLNAAVAKNAAELASLRRKGERDYFEFEVPKKNQAVKVQDIQLMITKTDQKKGKYNVTIMVDDNKLEKKDRTINEPVQFLVGQNRLRYEIVINWVQKADRVGGYLSVPKDKELSAERAITK
jgi:septal ring factor EnvC (AmiA/AmiB activator)